MPPNPFSSAPAASRSTLAKHTASAKAILGGIPALAALAALAAVPGGEETASLQ